MNQIRFDVRHSKLGNLIIPVIDGKSLISILKDVELPLAKKEGSSKTAGAYDGLPISIVSPPSEYYYGGETHRTDKKTTILVCKCLCAGCWDFVAEIKLKERKIVWKNFEQIHRRNWNYVELNVFEFDKEQFASALKELESK